MEQEELIQQIITAYYKPLRRFFKNKKASSVTDYQHVEANLDAFKKIYHTFDDRLVSIWEDFQAYDERSEGINYPYIGVFVKYNLMDKLLKTNHDWQMLEQLKREKYVARHRDLLQSMMEDDQTEYDVEVDVVCGSVDFYKGDPRYGNSFPTKAENNRLINYYYEKIIAEVR